MGRVPRRQGRGLETQFIQVELFYIHVSGHLNLKRRFLLEVLVHVYNNDFLKGRNGKQLLRSED